MLYKFTGFADGAAPYDRLHRDGYGNLYGTASGGGTAYQFSGFGVVFKLTPGGTETVLYTFTGGSDGGVPAAGLIADCNGNLYGAATQGGIAGGPGGAAGNGVVFKITPGGTYGGTYKVLYSFTGGSDGSDPFSDLISDGEGNLYGTASFGGITGGVGGTEGNGVVYEVSGTGFDASCKRHS